MVTDSPPPLLPLPLLPGRSAGSGGGGDNVRLVLCPKCRGLLPELPNVPLYKCGGCGATLRAKIRKQPPPASIPHHTNLGVSNSLQAVDDVVDAALSWIMFAPIGPGCHLLDMYMKGLLGGSDQQNEYQMVNVVRHSASKLHKYGVQFKTVGSYNDIEFNKSTATLKLPHFEINEYIISTFLNLKTYELRGYSNTKELSSYIRPLDTLVESANDVSLIRSRGIILISLASDEAVVEVIKELKKDAVLDSNCNPSVVLKEVNEYVEGKPKWSWLLSYWRTIVGAATFLLVITLLQAIYSILSFHLRKQ